MIEGINHTSFHIVAPSLFPEETTLYREQRDVYG